MTRYLFRPLIALAALVLTQCTDEGSSQKMKGLREEIETLNQQTYEATQQIKRLKAQIESSRDEKSKLEGDRAKIDEDKAAADRRLQELKKEFDAYKQKYKLSIRTRAPGMPLEDFTALDGRAFAQVVLKEVADTVVRFSHRDGMMKLDPKLLPDDLQEKLGYLVPTIDVRGQELAHLTEKQLLRLKSAEHNADIEAIADRLTEVRAVKQKAQSSLSEASFRIRTLEKRGAGGTDELKRLVPQYEQAILEATGQILKLEVDLHAARFKGAN
jgi:chromosome segregation ATPase